MHGSASPIS